MDYQEPDFQTLVIDQKEYFYTQHYEQDFSDVKGQEVAKRAALIAAAGMHNILFEGSPGSGKSMIAKRLRYILPPLNADELLTIAKHESLRGEEPTFAPKRPFRSPHHSSSKPSLFGGGSGHNAQMGEVAMAHLGLLFFDELPHFAKNSLEALREPLEDRKILISRVNAKLEYDADFMFVSAMNPCPCGNLLSKTRDCRCSDLEISRYQNRLSDPFLDRIDLHVQMQESDSRDQPSVSSKTLHEEVIGAFKQQKMRGQTALNGVLSDQAISKFCQLDEMTQMILDQATQRFALSARSINKVLKVARTIADLSGSHQIEKAHILEALSYRKR
jgi:magnesium chelatase family protein